MALSCPLPIKLILSLLLLAALSKLPRTTPPSPRFLPASPNFSSPSLSLPTLNCINHIVPLPSHQTLPELHFTPRIPILASTILSD